MGLTNCEPVPVLVLHRCRIPWGPAKKNSTKIIMKPNGKRKTVSIDRYVQWERAVRLKFVTEGDFLPSFNNEIEVRIFAYPASMRPDVHNQIDGVLDAMQCVIKRGLMIESGLIRNDRQVKKVSIEFVKKSKEGYLEVTVLKL